MAYITFKNTSIEMVSIPYWFVTDYMPRALGGYVKAYIYLLSAYQDTQESIDLTAIAKKLDMLYSEIIIALKYWDKERVLQFTQLDDENFELCFFTTKPTELITPPTVVKQEMKIHLQQTRPLYTADELLIYKKENQSITDLFHTCESHLGRLLTNTDQQVIFGFYDWLNMPFDLIEYLIEYCASNNHTNIRYIEKVALGWNEKGITTVESAKHQASFTQQYRQILKALGMNSETITKYQQDLFNHWLNTFPLTIILEACNRTMVQASSPSLNYVSSILDSWSKQGVKTMEDITKLDQSRPAKPIKEASKIPQKNKSFTTMYSHDWDLEELEDLASDYMEHTLYGGKNS